MKLFLKYNFSAYLNIADDPEYAGYQIDVNNSQYTSIIDTLKKFENCQEMLEELIENQRKTSK